MPDEVLDQTAELEKPAQAAESETAPDKTGAEQADATDATEKVAETDEQKNERVTREAKEASEKRSRGVQRRIDELTADKHAERKRADELAATNARILALLEAKQTGTTKPAGEPTRDQFGDYEDFIIARAEHRAELKASAVTETASKAVQERLERDSATREEQAAMADYSKREREFAAKTPDFAKVVEESDGIRIPAGVHHMITRMADGPVIAYHMLKNPALAEQFNTQPEYMHGILLGQLSATLKSPQKSSTAPAPGRPASSKTGSATEPPSDPELYRAWADKHMR